VLPFVWCFPDFGALDGMPCCQASPHATPQFFWEEHGPALAWQDKRLRVYQQWEKVRAGENESKSNTQKNE